MSQQPTNNRLIAKNATMLYIRMFFSMAIQFFTSRIVLQALGVSDFGLYNLVGGIIVLVNMLSGSLSSATSRYITVALGEGDEDKLARTFSSALIIHLALSGLFLIVAETVGLWFVNTQLVISPNRMIAANWVYQVAVCSTVLDITQTPYNATIRSHENFKIFAYIDILSSALKLLIALIVLWDNSVDNLILYSILYALVSITIRIFYRKYCINHYPETRFRFLLDKSIFPNLLSYSAWNMFGSITLTISQQATNIMYNWFLGNIVIAAAGIAGQVQGTLNSFAGNIMGAFNPQIVKEYARKNYKRVNELICMGAKFASVMTLVVSIPVFVKMHFLMDLWLDKVPEGAVIICRIFLIRSFLNNFNPLTYTAITAGGKVKWVNFMCGVIYLISLPIGYIILYFTRSYVWLTIASIFTGAVPTGFVYMYLLKKQMPEFNVTEYFRHTIIPMCTIGALVLFLALAMNSYIHHDLLGLVSVIVFAVVGVLMLSFYTVFDSYTRTVALQFAREKLRLKF